MNKMLENMRGRKWKIGVMIFVAVILFVGSIFPNTSYAIKDGVNSINIGGRIFTRVGTGTGLAGSTWKDSAGNTYHDVNYGENTGGLLPLDANGNPQGGDKSVGYSINDAGAVTPVTSDSLNLPKDTPKASIEATLGNLLGWFIYMISSGLDWILSNLVWYEK